MLKLNFQQPLLQSYRQHNIVFQKSFFDAQKKLFLLLSMLFNICA